MKDERLIPLMERYASTRDTALRDELLEAYLPLSRAVARKFAGRGAEMDDLEQIAAMALFKALERFQPQKGYRFVTYAVPTITGDIKNYLRDHSGLMRMPRDMRQRLYEMSRAQEKWERENGRTPTALELAGEMKISPEELMALLNMKMQSETISMDVPVGQEQDTMLSDLLGSDEKAFAEHEQSEWMQWILSKVSQTERQLLLLRYRDGKGQRDVAKEMGISQMQVSRLERRVLSRLRNIETGHS